MNMQSDMNAMKHWPWQDKDGYHTWGSFTAALAGQLSSAGASQSYSELWNEPDLTGTGPPAPDHSGVPATGAENSRP